MAIKKLAASAALRLRALGKFFFAAFLMLLSKVMTTVNVPNTCKGLSEFEANHKTAVTSYEVTDPLQPWHAGVDS